MKMLAFVISLGVLYWAVISYAQIRVAAVEPCPEAVNISAIGHLAEAARALPEGETGEFEIAQIAAEPAAGAACIR
jgi:hypothetical protein